MNLPESEIQHYEPGSGFSWKDIRGELIIINMDSGEYHSFNEMGRFIWLEIIKKKGVDEIIKQVIKHYDVDFKKANSDARKFFNNMLQRGLLRPANSK